MIDHAFFKETEIVDIARRCFAHLQAEYEKHRVELFAQKGIATFTGYVVYKLRVAINEGRSQGRSAKWTIRQYKETWEVLEKARERLEFLTKRNEELERENTRLKALLNNRVH